MKKSKTFVSVVNKFANSSKLFGLFLLLISAVGLVSYRPETEAYWNAKNLFLMAVLIVGVVLTIVGEALWKIVLKYSDATHRQFYFYDEE